MSWIAVGVAGVTLATKVTTGIIQNNKANKIERENKYPTATVQPEYEQNVKQAESMSQVGLPQQQYNNQSNNIARNQAAGLAVLSRSANPGAGVAGAIRAGNNATADLNAQDAMQRNRNLLNLLQERRILAGQKDKAWDWNFQQKYLGNLAKSQALRASGNANISSGVSDASSLAGSMAGGGMMGGSRASTGGGSADWGGFGDYRYRGGNTALPNYGDPNYLSAQWGGSIGG